jgi:CHAT domain-containing protein
VSHWQATSSVTSRLMIAFHRHLRRGNSEAVALQKAQEEIRRDRLYRHPYYWAPFAVVGAQ